jgi:hypothetical protein
MIRVIMSAATCFEKLLTFMKALRASMQFNIDLCGLTMLRDIVQRFLRHSKKAERDVRK